MVSGGGVCLVPGGGVCVVPGGGVCVGVEPSPRCFLSKHKNRKQSPLKIKKIMPPSFLTFFNPSKFERPTAFSLRFVLYALCLPFSEIA